MRILHWTESFWPRLGGAERMVHALAAEQQRRGDRCVVVTDAAASLAARDAIDDITVRRLPFQATLAVRDLKAVVALTRAATQLIDEFAPDIIHLHTSQPSAFFFLRASRTRPVPAVYTTHDPASAASAPLLNEIIAAVDAIAAISPFMYQRFRSLSETARSKTCEIMNGLPTPPGEPPRLPGDPPVIFGAGRLTRTKGFDVLLQATARVKTAIPAVSVSIAGDGDARRDLEALAAQLRLDDTVTFHGWAAAPAITRLIDESTVVAVPSRWEEPFGLMALEAMQRSRAVVASRTGGLADLVRDADTGRLVAPGDPAALADALVDLLSNLDLAAAMGTRGHHLATELFGWERCIGEYDALYREVLR